MPKEKKNIKKKHTTKRTGQHLGKGFPRFENFTSHEMLELIVGDSLKKFDNYIPAS